MLRVHDGAAPEVLPPVWFDAPSAVPTKAFKGRIALVTGAAQGVGEELVAVADAEHGDAVGDDVGEPAGGGFAPAGAVGDHGVGAGDDDAGDAGRGGQGFADAGIDDAHGQAGGAEAFADPGIVVAVVGDEFGDGISDFDDHQGFTQYHSPLWAEPVGRLRAGSRGRGWGCGGRRADRVHVVLHRSIMTW